MHEKNLIYGLVCGDDDPGNILTFFKFLLDNNISDASRRINDLNYLDVTEIFYAPCFSNSNQESLSNKLLRVISIEKTLSKRQKIVKILKNIILSVINKIIMFNKQTTKRSVIDRFCVIANKRLNNLIESLLNQFLTNINNYYGNQNTYTGKKYYNNNDNFHLYCIEKSNETQQTDNNSRNNSKCNNKLCPFYIIINQYKKDNKDIFHIHTERIIPKIEVVTSISQCYYSETPKYILYLFFKI